MPFYESDQKSLTFYRKSKEIETAQKGGRPEEAVKAAIKWEG